MLIGILCEVVTAVGQEEREEAAISLMKKTVLLELKKFDADGSGTISQEELEKVLCSRQTLRVLEKLDIDEVCLRELTGMLFAGAPEDIK